MKKIDVVVTYLDSGNKKWQEGYFKYKEEEIEGYKAKEEDRQAFGIERIRNWDNFRYFLRGIEKNCKWVNKVFVIVQDKEQLPKWLNTDYDKLRIVEHNEYVPKELLPTYNAMTIQLFINRIDDLSDNYVICDDDFFFLNEIEENRFFRDDKPVHVENRMNYGMWNTNGESPTWSKILNNNIMFEERFMGKDKRRYGVYHLPTARAKWHEKQIMDDYYDFFVRCQSWSRFRNEHNLCSCLYEDMAKIMGIAYIDNNIYNNSAYVTLKSNVDFDSLKDKDMVCFNDTEQLDDFEKTKAKLDKFLNKMLGDKSKYEL